MAAHTAFRQAWKIGPSIADASPFFRFCWSSQPFSSRWDSHPTPPASASLTSVPSNVSRKSRLLALKRNHTIGTAAISGLGLPFPNAAIGETISQNVIIPPAAASFERAGNRGSNVRNRANTAKNPKYTPTIAATMIQADIFIAGAAKLTTKRRIVPNKDTKKSRRGLPVAGLPSSDPSPVEASSRRGPGKNLATNKQAATNPSSIA